MAVALVQSKDTIGEALGLSLAFTSNVTAGNTIIVGIRIESPSETPTGLTDSLSNVYTLAIGPIRGLPNGGSGNASFWVYYAKNISGGACTVSFSGSSGIPYKGLEIHEVSGLSTTAPFDASDSISSGHTTSPHTVGTVSLSTTNGFIYAMITTDEFEQTAPSGFTLYDCQNSYNWDTSAYKAATASGSYTASFGGSGLCNYTGVVVAFKEAGGGGGGHVRGGAAFVNMSQGVAMFGGTPQGPY